MKKDKNITPPKKPEIKPDEELLKLKEELLTVKNQRDEFQDKYLRTLAELENFRKRQIRIQKESYDAFADSLFNQILPIIDNLERALANSSKDSHLREGLELIYKQMNKLLSNYGIEEISCHLQPFDPMSHEPIITKPTTTDNEGKILEVCEKGYKRGSRIIRAPKVIVGVCNDENEDDEK